MVLRRDSRFESDGGAVVTAFDDLADFMEPGDDVGLRMRHRQFHELSRRPKLRAQFLEQDGQAIALFR